MYNSAYQSWSGNFLQMRNRQAARAFQLTAVVRFQAFLAPSPADAAGPIDRRRPRSPRGTTVQP